MNTTVECRISLELSFSHFLSFIFFLSLNFDSILTPCRCDCRCSDGGMLLGSNCFPIQLPPPLADRSVPLPTPNYPRFPSQLQSPLVPLSSFAFIYSFLLVLHFLLATAYIFSRSLNTATLLTSIAKSIRPLTIHSSA